MSKEVEMFAYNCPTCGQETLISPRQIHHVVNDDQGVVVIFECWCGELAALRTGKASLGRQVSSPAAPAPPSRAGAA